MEQGWDILRSKLHAHVLIRSAVIRASLDREILPRPLQRAECPRTGIVDLAAHVLERPRLLDRYGGGTRHRRRDGRRRRNPPIGRRAAADGAGGAAAVVTEAVKAGGVVKTGGVVITGGVVAVDAICVRIVGVIQFRIFDLVFTRRRDSSAGLRFDRLVDFRSGGVDVQDHGIIIPCRNSRKSARFSGKNKPVWDEERKGIPASSQPPLALVLLEMHCWTTTAPTVARSW